jgi:hypothetical protein
MVKASGEEVGRGLKGNWRDDLLFELRQTADSYHLVHQQMRACDQQLESFLASLPTKSWRGPSSQTHQPLPPKRQRRRGNQKARRNEPTVDPRKRAV